MNKRELANKRKKTYNSYHIPGCTPIHRLKQNAVFLNSGYTPSHELAKAIISYYLKKDKQMFITEAVRNKENIRVDVVSLDRDVEIEVVNKHDTKDVLERYEREGVLALRLTDSMIERLESVCEEIRKFLSDNGVIF